jgi:REP element-mobilizing transposase RayT
MSVDESGKNQQSTLFKSPRGEEIYDSSNQVLFEEIHPEVNSLSYTFFLIPETPLFQLTGDLVELLPKWLKEICAINGWSLEFVTVDPNYLQWALSIPIVVATLQVINQVRSKLTEHILDTNKGKVEFNNSIDIWAHGYLLLNGINPHAIEVIDRYIRLIRVQQQK